MPKIGQVLGPPIASPVITRRIDRWNRLSCCSALALYASALSRSVNTGEVKDRPVSASRYRTRNRSSPDFVFRSTMEAMLSAVLCAHLRALCLLEGSLRQNVYFSET